MAVLQGTNRALLVGFVVFLAISLYTLVVTHHLHLSDYFDRSAAAHEPAALSAQELFGQLVLDTTNPEAFASRLSEQGAFQKYDTDNDGKVTQAEFREFLVDLAKSRVLPEDTPDRLALKQALINQLLAELKGKSGVDLKVVSTPGGAAQPATGATAATAKPAVEDKPAVEVTPAADATAATAQPPVEDKPAVETKPTADPATPKPDDATAAAVVTEQQSTPASATSQGQGCPELTRELIASFAVNNTIMLTVCDWRIFESLGINWMKHLNSLGIKYYIVGATDSSTSQYLSGQGNHPCFKFFEEGYDEHAGKEYKYGSDHYRAATWRKVTVVEKIVDWGFNVLHSDVDVVWFQDPLPYFLGPNLTHVDVAVSTDLISTGNLNGDHGLEANCHQSTNVNTGVYFVKSTDGGKKFMAKWAGLREKMAHDNDQVGLYHYIRGPGVRQNYHMRRLEFPDGPMLGMLSVGMLLNGYSYFIPKLHEARKLKPLGVHMTWLPLSREGKFHRIRDGMLYFDSPEYYNEPNFITADLDFPPAPTDYNMWRDTEAMIQFHLRAIDKQLVQVYRVMAIATMLNRTLILPKMQCFCYKNWFMMEQCKIPGDQTTQFPIECHLDQWLRPKVIYNYGPNIVSEDGARAFGFREHSLLQNPRFPRETIEKQVVVVPGDAASGPAVDAAGERIATVPRKLKQKQLVEAFSKFKDVKLLRIRKPMQLFGGFDDQKLKESFERFVDKVAGNWCCRDKPFIEQGMKEKEKLAITEALTTRVFLDDKNVSVPDPAWR